MSHYLVSYYSQSLVWAAMLGALVLTPFALSHAQDRMMVRDVDIAAGPMRALDADSDGDGLDDGTQKAGYNNSRSNRSTIKVQNDPPQVRANIDALDADDDGDGISTEATNVCDGVTCPDGSCAATASECSVFDRELRANYNNTRSNRSTLRDSRAVEEEVRRATRGLDDKFEQIATSVAPARFRDADSDGDGLDDGTQRANYNNSRSNRANIAGEENRIDWRQLRGPRMGLQTAVDNVGEDSPARERLLEKLDAVQTTVPATLSQQGRLMNAEDGPTATSTRARIAINARELRDLDNEERRELVRLQAGLDKSSPEYKSLRLAQRAIEDSRIETVEQDEQSTRVKYRARMDLFGFIPMVRTVTAEQRTNSDEPDINYPWYRIFAATPDTDSIRSFFTQE